jgi:hypothetical protein
LFFLPCLDLRLRDYAHVFALDLALLLVMVGEIFGLRVVLLEQVDVTPALHALRVDLGFVAHTHMVLCLLFRVVVSLAKLRSFPIVLLSEQLARRLPPALRDASKIKCREYRFVKVKTEGQQSVIMNRAIVCCATAQNVPRLTASRSSLRWFSLPGLSQQIRLSGGALLDNLIVKENSVWAERSIGRTQPLPIHSSQVCHLFLFQPLNPD